MKRTILYLIAATTLLFGWTVQAADETVQKPPTAATQPAAATPLAAVPAAAQETKAPVKRAKSPKRAKAKTARPHDLDLRHCLDLKTYAEIANCAGE